MIATPSGGPRDVIENLRALHQAQTFRRLVVKGSGLLTLIALIDNAIEPKSGLAARLFPVVLFVVPVLWAWLAEVRAESLIKRRLDEVGGFPRAMTKRPSRQWHPAGRPVSPRHAPPREIG
jgi:hypothetical protein